MQIQNNNNLFNKISQKDVAMGAAQKAGEEAQESAKPQYENEVVTSDVVSAYFNVKKAENKQTPQYENNLRTKFQENKAVIYALIPRTFNAQDKDGNELIGANEQKGTFLNAIDRLDELKSYGVNALHILPCYEPNTEQAMGTAGSIYSVADFLQLDSHLDDKADPRTVDEEFKQFTDECHKRGISVMIDIPGCAGIELYNDRPELMAKNPDGTPKIPQGWQDIRMFEVWEDKDKQKLNQALVDYHKQIVDKYMDLGVDGFRVDVARSKPTKFWIDVISHARTKNPECAFLAESYTYEDASPMANVAADRPEDLLKAGFDSYYGQYHIFHEWPTAQEFHDNMILNLEMSKNLPGAKSLIGSFATHDDKSPMTHGGADYCNLTTGLQETLPMTNPYFVSGFETGDEYKYDYTHKTNIAMPLNAETRDKLNKAFSEFDKVSNKDLNVFITDTKTNTDCNKFTAHASQIDIFNASTKPQGDHPEIGTFMTDMAKIREKYEDVITKGSYIPLQTTNKQDKVIAYARHLNGKTLLIIANKDTNGTQSANINIKGLKADQQMVDIAPKNAGDATIEAKENNVSVKLSPAKFMMFEIDTPDIEKSGVKVYKQQNI